MMSSEIIALRRILRPCDLDPWPFWSQNSSDRYSCRSELFCDLEIAVGNAIQDRRRQTWTTIANCYANCLTICRFRLLSSHISVFRAWFLIVLSFLSSHYHLYMLQFSQWAERCVLTVLSLILVLCYDYFTLFSFDKSVYICAFIVLITVYDMLV